MGIEHLAGGGRVAVVHDVLLAEGERIHAERAGELVHMRLDSPVRLRRRRSAHRARRLVVRVREVRLNVDGREAIRPDCVHTGELGEEPGVGRVGTVVDDQLGAARRERAVGLHTGLELDHHALAAMVGSDELLAAREHELRRALGLAGNRRHVGLKVELALATEAATEVGDDDTHLVLGHAEGVRNAGAGVERHLGGRPDRDLIAMPLGDDGARLDRRGVLHVSDVALADNMIGCGKARLDVAVDDRRVARVVAVADDVVRVPVVLPVGVHERRASGERRLDVVDDRQGLDVDLDQIARVLCDLGRCCGHGGDDLALEAHVLLREQPSILDVAAVLEVGGVLVRDDGEDAGQGLGLGRVDAREATGGDVGVQKLAVRKSGQLQIGRVAAKAGDLVFAVLALERPVLDRGHAAPLAVEP